MVLALRWIEPPTSAFMITARWRRMFAGEHDYRTGTSGWRWSRSRRRPRIAVIASEDQQFPFHAGFDFKSIREAVRAHERGHELHGASTITQQVAKNLFLWSGRSFVRKGLEACSRCMIETLWPKERILEVYLNIVEFGRGIYGVEAAARQFFHGARSPDARAERAAGGGAAQSAAPARRSALRLCARPARLDPQADGGPRRPGIPPGAGAAQAGTARGPFAPGRAGRRPAVAIGAAHWRVAAIAAIRAHGRP